MEVAIKKGKQMKLCKYKLFSFLLHSQPKVKQGLNRFFTVTNEEKFGYFLIIIPKISNLLFLTTAFRFKYF